MCRKHIKKKGDNCFPSFLRRGDAASSGTTLAPERHAIANGNVDVSKESFAPLFLIEFSRASPGILKENQKSKLLSRYTSFHEGSFAPIMFEKPSL
jgi:hypothetical protein